MPPTKGRRDVSGRHKQVLERRHCGRGGGGGEAGEGLTDVDKDGLYLLLGEDNLKRLLDGSGGRASSDVEEVGGVAAVELEDVHRRHGEAGAVDEAANVAVELDEVEAVLGGVDLSRVLLRLVAHGKDVLLAELGVLVKAELGVHAGSGGGGGGTEGQRACLLSWQEPSAGRVRLTREWCRPRARPSG